MMNTPLQAYTEEAENLLFIARKCIPNFYNPAASHGRPVPNLYQMLAEVRKEELRSTFSLADPSIEQNHIQLTDSKLIEKLVQKERLNTLIFNLYPANKGYTLSVISRNGDSIEKTLSSMRIPYTEEQLFSYIDNEEIPPLLCEVIDKCVVPLYYGGCIVAEIRDYRKSSSINDFVRQHVLLHQSMQTIVNDVNEAIKVEKHPTDSLSSKLEFEKSLLIANYGPLCLSPRPSIAIASQKLHYSKYFLNTRRLQYKARKHTLLGIAQRKRLELHTKCSPSIAGLVDFIAKKRNSKEHKSKVVKKHLPECHVSNDFWTEAARSVLELAKPIERPLEIKETIFNSKIIEEYSIETRDEAGLKFNIKMTISQRNSDSEYIGEILQCRELNTGGFNNISYSFPLGTRELATRYVLEFTNVYTERGKIQVNFTHRVPGKAPEAYVTSGLRLEGNKLVPIESQSLGLHTMVPLETLSSLTNDPIIKNVVGSRPNVIAPVGDDDKSPSRESLQNLQIHQNLQQFIPQKRKQTSNVQLQTNVAAVNLKTQIQEQIQLRQSNPVNGIVTPNFSHVLSLRKKDSSNSNPSQTVYPTRTFATVLPKSLISNLQYSTSNTDTTGVTSGSGDVSPVNANNSTILSLLANTNAQSACSSQTLTNITLGNLLTTTTSRAAGITSQTITPASGQKIVGKRVKMQGARVIPSNAHGAATSLANASVIAAATTSTSPNNGANLPQPSINAQPLIRLSLSSLQNQGATVIQQQRSGKNITGRIIPAMAVSGGLKTASVVSNVQPTIVTSGGVQIGNNSVVHSLSAMQTLLNGGCINASAPVTGLRMKTAGASVNVRRNVVSGIQSLAVNSSFSAGSTSETQNVNCSTIQSLSGSQNSIQCATTTSLTPADLQTMTGSLTNAQTLLTCNVQTLPVTGVHLVDSTNSGSIVPLASKSSSTLSGLQVNPTSSSAILSETINSKGQKVIRLSNSETMGQNIGLPMSTLSALLSGSAVSDGTISSSTKTGYNLIEKMNAVSTVPSNSAISISPGNGSSNNLNNPNTANVDMQSLHNVQVSIPGIAVPITLSLNVADQINNSCLDELSQNQTVGTVISNVMGTPTVILTTSIAGNSGKPSNLRPVASTAAATNVSSTAVQQIQFFGQVQKNKITAQATKPVVARSLLNTPRMRLGQPSLNAVVQQQAGNQSHLLSVSAQQQLQLALQKQAAQLQLHQGLTTSGGIKVAQKRRRSSVTTDSS